MEVKAIGKYISISPKKAREVADLVRGKGAKEAVQMTRLMSQSAAREIGKVLSSAMANAENNFNLDKEKLTVSRIMIDGGPKIKRFRPRARGSAAPIERATSHITIIVSGDVKTKRVVSPAKEKATPQKKDDTKSEVSESIEKEAGEHKIEIERPDFVKKEQNAPRFGGIKDKFFRRKTG